MNAPDTSIAAEVRTFCAHIGIDPLLVQGAGGNVSWKDGDTLWVKASGTWLAEAEVKDIFVPVNLPHLQVAISKQDYSVLPKVTSESKLRPSIETLLHALMPHKVVAHLHAVEILSHLVRANPEKEFEREIGDAVSWACVDYFKPGADLAKAVAGYIAEDSKVDVVFLRNHGIVIGGKSVEQVESILHQLLSLLKVDVPSYATPTKEPEINLDLEAKGYNLCSDPELNRLAVNKELSSRLQGEWALFPDHVVFLGEEAFIDSQLRELHKLDAAAFNKPPFIFVIGKGVFESQSVTKAQKAQLRCYYDVVIRQKITDKLLSLNKRQIGELLDWDAEKYRQKTSTELNNVQ